MGGWEWTERTDLEHRQEARQDLERTLAEKSTTLAQLIEHRFSLLYGVQAFVLSRSDLFTQPTAQTADEMQRFLAQLHAAIPDVRAVMVSPGAVHRYVYPLTETSRKTIGNNLLQDRRQTVREKVTQTIARKTIGLSGPYSLRQDGSLSLEALLPIFHEGEFWGLTAMVVNVPSMLAKAGIVEGGAYTLAVPGQAPFFGDPQVLNRNPITARIPLSDGTWEIAASGNVAGIPTWEKAVILALSGLLGLLLGRQLFAATTQGIRLQRVVNAATAELSQKIDELKAEQEKVQQLEGILPICSYCKKIRDGQQGWHELEAYISNHSEAHFSHGICPDCADRARRDAEAQIAELQNTHPSE